MNLVGRFVGKQIVSCCALCVVLVPAAAFAVVSDDATHESDHQEERP